MISTSDSVPETLDDILDFYKKADDTELFATADAVTREHHGDKVLIRGLIEHSSYCSSNCLYCGIRRDNANAGRYRIFTEDIIELARQGFEKGFRTFVIQGGEDPAFTHKDLCHAVEEIKKLSHGEAAITLSCGEKTREQYSDLKSAGADRYLMRFETSDPELHRYFRDGKTLKNRLKALETIRECGFQTGSGYMTGLPGETEETRINNALLCRKMEFDMLGIGPFIPHGDTPLGQAPQESLRHAVRATALVRLLLPKAHIPATTAAGTLKPDGREQMLMAGANVLMPNLTPPDNKKHYLLYPGKICLDESGFQCLSCLGMRVKTLNKELAMERGDCLTWKERSCAVL